MAFRDPVFGISYGQSKVGKTTDNLFSLPNAFYIAQPGALKPSEAVCGFVVPPQNVYDATDIEDAMAKLRELKTKKLFKEVVVDDLSFLADKTYRKMSMPKSAGGEGLDGWKLWGAVYNRILDFRDEARHAGIHVFLNAHEKLPDLPKRRGGPRLPGQLPEQMPAACDLVVRATMLSGAEAMGKLGWKGIYRCAPWDTNWITGDRHGTPDYMPMNIGEILRAVGFEVTRPKGLEKMEQYVETMANDLLGAGPANDKAIAQQYAKFFEANNIPSLLSRWVIRDALDRVTIRRARANPLALYGI